jgi:hypothetical protein
MPLEIKVPQITEESSVSLVPEIRNSALSSPVIQIHQATPE